ncbi:MAG TPA: hypothetical protein VG324_22670 [Blastocatellia bacterium]|nr:hypothetical protein [Blastocatellia bacterium]
MGSGKYQDIAQDAGATQWTEPTAPAGPDSSLMRSGPFHRFQQTLHLEDPLNPRTARRALLFALVSWLPMVALAAVQGLAVNADPRRSLLLDLTVYARFLVAVPFFILGESVADRRYSMIVNYLLCSGIVTGTERQAYDELLSSTRRLRDSRAAEILWVVLAYVGAFLSVLFYHAKSEQSTWLVDGAAGSIPLSWAGCWYAAVSLPLFQFLLYRSVWSWLIWVRFLWRMSRLRLRLTPTHPDLVGGLNILGDSPYAIAVFVFAIGAVLSAALIMQISYEGASVVIYHNVFIVYLLLATMISFGPLLVFIGKLDRLRQRGLRDYGTLANRHAQLFDEKWIIGAGVTEDIVEIPLGSPDTSSISGLKSSYETVKRMRFFPFGLRALLVLAAAALIPMVPLMLMEFPLQKILKTIAGFVL